MNFSYLLLKEICAKFSKITSIWENGHGVVFIQLFSEANHYEALSREFSMIKSIGINNLSNAINSSAYGDMQLKWNCNEIRNFGTMLIFNALVMAARERP